MKRIQINLGNKTFYTLIAIISILALAGIAFALDSWQIHGHDATEIGNLPSGIDSIGGVSYDFPNRDEEVPLNCATGKKAISCGIRRSRANFGNTDDDAVGCYLMEDFTGCYVWQERNNQADGFTGYCYCA